MTTLFVLNESPYGNERSYNGLRHAMAVAKQPDQEVQVYILGDAAGCAVKGQKTPDGYYNTERMLKGLIQKGATVVS